MHRSYSTRQRFVVPLVVAGVPLAVAAILPFGYLALGFVAGLAEIIGLRVPAGWGFFKPRTVGLYGLGAVVMATGIYLSATYWRALRSDPASWPSRAFWWVSAVFNVVLFGFLLRAFVLRLIRDRSGGLGDMEVFVYVALWILWIGYVAAVSLYNAIYRPEAETAPEAEAS